MQDLGMSCASKSMSSIGKKRAKNTESIAKTDINKTCNRSHSYLNTSKDRKNVCHEYLRENETLKKE